MRAQFFKPEQGHLCEQSTLAGNGLAHDDVKSAKPVTGKHEDAVSADGVVVTDLTARQQRQGMQGGGVQGKGHKPHCSAAQAAVSVHYLRQFTLAVAGRNHAQRIASDLSALAFAAKFDIARFDQLLGRFACGLEPVAGVELVGVFG